MAYVSLVLLACIARGPGIFVLLYVLYGESSVYGIVLEDRVTRHPPVTKVVELLYHKYLQCTHTVRGQQHHNLMTAHCPVRRRQHLPDAPFTPMARRMIVVLLNRSQDGAIDGSLDGREMQLLLGLPWNIEVMLSRDSVPTSGLQLRVDTVADALSKEDLPNAGAAATGTPGATKMVSARVQQLANHLARL